MLVKSRSKGDAKLRMEEPFHLEVVHVWDAGGSGTNAATTVYCFYLWQASAGRVASSVALGAGDGPLLPANLPKKVGGEAPPPFPMASR